jgi:fructose-1,6-bisphosphatase/inositol monophosphatase family enzyme
MPFQCKYFSTTLIHLMSLQGNRLFLPALQKTAWPDVTTVCPAETEHFITVPDTFIEVWTYGPHHSSPNELMRCMLVLVPEFGRLAQRGQGNVKVFEKENNYDWVTEVDQGIEMLLRLWIRRFYPTHKIVGEEGFKDVIDPNDWVWFIDPIDGTTNFVEGQRTVSMHIGLFHNGEPVLCMVGLPILGQLYFNDPDSHDVFFWDYEHHQAPIKMDKKSFGDGIGTEYLDARTHEDDFFKHISKDCDLFPIRVRSIGVNILSFIEGKMKVFYKPKVKLWDIMAPLGLVHCLYKDDLQFEMVFSEKGKKESPLFAWSDDLRIHINAKHQASCRVGLCLVYPKKQPVYRKKILAVLE